MRHHRTLSFGLFLPLLVCACAPAGAPAQPKPAELVGSPQTAQTESAVSTADCGPAPGAGPIFLENQVTQPPRVLEAGRVRYPVALRNAGISGRVRVGYVIDSLGKAVPGSLLVLETTHPGFVDPARTTIEEGRYAPGLVLGHPVAVCMVTTIRFEG